MVAFRINPSFWLVSALLGYYQSGSLVGVALWIGVLLVSLLVHELGHALCAISFGRKAAVTILGMGGVTTFGTYDLSRMKQVLIALSGPLFSAVLFFFSYLGWQFYAFDYPFIASIFYVLQWVNLIWMAINLLPVLPLDGGHIMQLALAGLFQEKGEKYANAVSLFLSAFFVIFFLLFSYYLAALLFGVFAFRAYNFIKRP